MPVKDPFIRILSGLNNAFRHAKGKPMTKVLDNKYVNIVSTLEEIEEYRKDTVQEELIKLAAGEWEKVNPEEEPDDDEMDIITTSYLERNKDWLLARFIAYSQPGTYNCHEALDRTAQLMDPVAKLMDCDSIIANPDYYVLAYQAHEALFNLYQAIGYHHMEAIPDDIVKLIEAKKVKK